MNNHVNDFRRVFALSEIQHRLDRRRQISEVFSRNVEHVLTTSSGGIEIPDVSTDFKNMILYK